MHLRLLLAALAVPTTLAAQDFVADPDIGAREFSRQCVSCHVVRTEDGEVIAGRNGRTGPNLYRLSQRAAGSVDGFRYSRSLMAYGEENPEQTWDVEAFVGYVQDPTAWLRDALGDRRARGKMAYRVRNAEHAMHIFAYLEGLNPEDETGG